MSNYFDPKTDPVIIVEEDHGSVVIDDPPRVINVTNLSHSEAQDLEFDVERYFKTYSNPRRIDDYVFIAIAQSDNDLISDREIKAAVAKLYNDPVAMQESAKEYCLYSVDGDTSQLDDRDLIDQAFDYAMAYHNVCGCVSEIYNSKAKGGIFDPKCAYFLTKIGHVLKQMLYGTESKVSL